MSINCSLHQVNNMTKRRQDRALHAPAEHAPSLRDAAVVALALAGRRSPSRRAVRPARLRPEARTNEHSARLEAAAARAGRPRAVPTQTLS